MQLIDRLWTSLLLTVSPNAKSERGQTLVEYGLIIALVSLAAIVALTAIGTNLGDVFNKIGNKLS